VRLIGLAPFVAIAAQRPDGRVDVGARAGVAGFARVVGESKLLIPDTPQGRIGMGLRDLGENAPVGLLFLVPGIGETSCVNGRARVIDDPALLDAPAAGDRPAVLGVVIEVREATLEMRHEAFAAARLWDPRHLMDLAARLRLATRETEAVAPRSFGDSSSTCQPRTTSPSSGSLSSANGPS
jgi:predicted pyridoxine 5'-phosphate oxidase superfamily flavin-nucleotide-binding protein